MSARRVLEFSEIPSRRLIYHLYGGAAPAMARRQVGSARFAESTNLGLDRPSATWRSIAMRSAALFSICDRATLLKDIDLAQCAPLVAAFRSSVLMPDNDAVSIFQKREKCFQPYGGAVPWRVVADSRTITAARAAAQSSEIVLTGPDGPLSSI